MKIISWNVNGIRAAVKKGFLEWFKIESPDILCIQESKANEDQLSSEILESHGYFNYWHSGIKKGYSGVATFSKEEPLYVQIFESLIKLILTLYVALTTLLYGVENSDLFGLGLIVLAISLILLKWRQNLLNEYSIYEVCRSCNNRIHRIKRRKRIKIFAYIFRLKIKRYQCTACNQVGYIIRPL